TILSTIAGSEKAVSDEALDELRLLVRSNVLTPGDPAYEGVRAPYNAMQVDRPALIVQCTGTAGVVDTVNFARSSGREGPGRGGGGSRRKYGLSCDNLVEAEVVGADGGVRVASVDSNPDLFWAIRGGGGNFGIVTSFTFRLHPLGPIVAFAGIFYPLADAVGILRKFRDYGDS